MSATVLSTFVELDLMAQYDRLKWLPEPSLAALAATPLEWSAKMKGTLGLAHYPPARRIALNNLLLNRLYEPYLIPTFLHEVAHIAAEVWVGPHRAKGHSFYWGHFMILFGLPPESNVRHNIPGAELHRSRRKAQTQVLTLEDF